MSQPLFTVATITYNSSKWVRQAIESVLASSYTDFEYLISDDYSTDDTWEIIKEYNDSRIKSWRNESNMGEYPNRNKVLFEAKGEYIFFLDGDDILYHHSLRVFSEYVEAFPLAAGIWGAGGMDSVVYPYEFNPKSLIQLISFSQQAISTVGFAESLFKVSVLIKVGGFSEKYISGDTYIKRRIACEYPVLLTNPGYAFWRTSEGQASKYLSKGYRSLIEMSLINEEIIRSDYFPFKDYDKEKILRYVHEGTFKILVKSTICRFQFIDFFKLIKILHIKQVDLLSILKRNKSEFSFKKPHELLINDFHFMK